jgi:hypothetical protein
VRKPFSCWVFALALSLVCACGGGSDPGGPSAAEGGADGNDEGLDAARLPTADSSAQPESGESRDAQGPRDAGGTVDGSNFQVGQLSGLALWLDAAKGITFHDGNYVRNWADQSKNHNDGISGEPHPVEEPTQVSPNPVFNGLASLHFTSGTYTTPNCDGEDCGAGNNIMINDSASLQWGTGDFLIEVVASYTNSDPESPEDTYAGTFFFRSAANGPWFRGNSYPTTPSTGLSALLSSKYQQDLNELVTQKTGYNDGKARLMAMQRVGTTVTIRVNGKVTDTKILTSALDVTGDIAPDAANPILVTVGAAYSDISRLDGDVAEVIAVKGTLAVSDTLGIEGYLMSKYAL